MIFSGSTTVESSTLSDYNFETGDFTLHCWMSATGSGPLFTQYSSGLSVEINPNGSIRFAVKSGERFQVAESTRTGLNDGIWRQVTAVKFGKELSLFVDGKKLTVTENWINQESAGLGEHTQLFMGNMGPISIWRVALHEEEVHEIFVKPLKGDEPGLLSIHDSGHEGNQEIAITAPLSVIITVNNTMNEVLEKQALNTDNIYYEQFPQQIPANSKIEITIEKPDTSWLGIECTVTYENSLGSIEIEILKSYDKYESGIVTRVGKDIIDQLDIILSEEFVMRANLMVSESLVMVMMKNFYNFLNALRGKLPLDRVKTGDGNLFNVVDYNKACQIFNLYFELKPLAIVYCTSAEEVQLVYKNAIANNLPVRVRSGGHDHEGECSGTDTIVIDMTGINHVRLAKPEGEDGPVYAHIGPGIRFISLTTILAQQGVMIPHGTCATVGIAGFTMGGGWGPWTRKAGMCCESLVGATIMLGDGTLEKLDATTGKVPELLWALRGGGGMSYGIVTELVIKTFPLPAELIKFEVEWNKYGVDPGTLTLIPNGKVPTLQVLNAWEAVIDSTDTQRLIGTNLKISAKNWDQDTYDNFDERKVSHNCIMYGYWEGDQKTLQEFISLNFKNVPGYDLRIDGEGGSRQNYGSNLMSNWDRESFYNVRRLLKGEKSKPLPPDLDAPAPHKITSRLVDAEGLSESGYRALLQSLTSPLISAENRELGLFSYITLGAISGNFYKEIKPEQKEQSAFPYKEKRYTIQYQTWWDEQLAAKQEGENNPVYEHTNRALDWMQVCRNFDIPGTSGAFISFKDSSIPTRVYFDKSYDKLVEIKKQFSRDPLNHFRTRKTII